MKENKPRTFNTLQAYTRTFDIFKPIFNEK